MAGENKKPKGRRAYLNDFLLNERGEYEYQGRLLHFEGTEDEYRRTMRLSIEAVVLMAILIIVPEILPSVPMSRFPVSAVLWLVQLISAGLVVYSVWKMCRGRNPIREYVHKASVKRLPGQTIVCAAASLALAVEQTIYILINGVKENAFFNIIRPAAAFVCAAAAYQFHLMIKRTEWN